LVAPIECRYGRRLRLHVLNRERFRVADPGPSAADYCADPEFRQYLSVCEHCDPAGFERVLRADENLSSFDFRIVIMTPMSRTPGLQQFLPHRQGDPLPESLLNKVLAKAP